MPHILHTNLVFTECSDSLDIFSKKISQLFFKSSKLRN